MYAVGMRAGNLFIVSGPSGAGKGTLVRALLERVPDFCLSISATTRAPRPGEKEGVHYFFVSMHKFEEMIAQGELLEWACVHGNKYGTPRDVVQHQIAQGKQVILEIDPQGAQQVKAAWPESVLVFVEAPSLDELRKRLDRRGSETREQIETRMARAIEEMELAGMYDFVITNEDVMCATNELVAIIDSYAGDADRRSGSQ